MELEELRSLLRQGYEVLAKHTGEDGIIRVPIKATLLHELDIGSHIAFVIVRGLSWLGMHRPDEIWPKVRRLHPWVEPNNSDLASVNRGIKTDFIEHQEARARLERLLRPASYAWVKGGGVKRTDYWRFSDTPERPVIKVTAIQVISSLRMHIISYVHQGGDNTVHEIAGPRFYYLAHLSPPRLMKLKG